MLMNILQREGLWTSLESARKNRFALVFFFILGATALCFLVGFLTSIGSLQEAIFRVVAAVLHLGNVEFAKGQEIDSSVLKDEKSRFHLNVTAELLM